jgi:hypothetical protein
MSEYDSPWKEALDRFLKLFLEFFFPNIATEIDWDRGYEVLDKELEQIVREGELGKRLADKLFKVWRKNGEETWVLIHLEIQSQKEEDFARRMYVYNYRIFDRFDHPVVSLAVLGDERADWRPTEFGYNIWGCEVLLRFPVVKLLDYADDPETLEAHPNLFGLIVLAHLQGMATQKDAQERFTWKVRLVKGLLDRGYTAEDIRQLFKMIYWLLELPEELEQQFEQSIHDYERAKKVEYVTSMERRAMKRGREEGVREGLLEAIETGLQQRFGDAGMQLLPAVRDITDVEKLRAIQQALWTATAVDEIRRLLPS